MNENDDNKFPKLHVAGNRIFEGETVYSQRTVDKLQAELAALRQQVNALTAALAWYADEDNGNRRVVDEDGEVWFSAIAKDGGLRASKALEAAKKQGNQTA